MIRRCTPGDRRRWSSPFERRFVFHVEHSSCCLLRDLLSAAQKSDGQEPRTVRLTECVDADEHHAGGPYAARQSGPGPAEETPRAPVDLCAAVSRETCELSLGSHRHLPGRCGPARRRPAGPPCRPVRRPSTVTSGAVAVAQPAVLARACHLPGSVEQSGIPAGTTRRPSLAPSCRLITRPQHVSRETRPDAVSPIQWTFSPRCGVTMCPAPSLASSTLTSTCCPRRHTSFGRRPTRAPGCSPPPPTSGVGVSRETSGLPALRHDDSRGALPEAVSRRLQTRRASTRPVSTTAG